MKGNKILATIVAIAMVVSTIAILNVSEVKATRYISTDNGYNAVVLSNDGSGAQYDNLTCGEIITLYVNNNSLMPGEDYAVKVWTDSGWVACYDVGSTDNADVYGDLAIQFHVPGWDELDECPTTGSATGSGLSAGQWNISLWTESTGGSQVWRALNITITIGNLYEIYYSRTPGGTAIDHLTYGEEETFDVNVRNWTGKDGWEDDASESDGVGTWNLDILTPSWSHVSGFPKNGITADYQEAYIKAYIEDYEYYYWVIVTNNANNNLLSNFTLPVKLNVTATIPSNLEWGDEFTISGYVYDANSTGISSYDVAVFAPVSTGKNGGWTEVATDGTLGNGKYSITPSTGPDTGYSAGTWYLGTYESGTIDEASMPPYIDDFIPYYSFVVETNDNAAVAIQNSDDIVSGFEQTINVSVKNDTFMYSGAGDSTKEFEHMKIHVTGLDGWDPVNKVEYDSNDIIEVTLYTQYYKDNEKYSYYLFNWTFNETGTAKIIASWPGNVVSHTRTSPKAGGNDSSYSNTYNESSAMLANITGERTFSVVSPAGMNLIIDDMVEAVSIDKNPGTCTGSTRWLNSSDTFLLKVYGSTQSDPLNATITVSGAGLDFTIDEDDPDDTDECIGYPGDGTHTDGQYLVQISPKTRGTISITATNGTDEVSRDYSITGLSGSVTTSIGDDLEITVGSTETITATLGSDYAEVYVTYFDSKWTQTNGDTISLNHTVGDGVTQGEGKDGVYTFVPDKDDIDALGYIVVAAEAGTEQYMYDIIEIVPIYDLTVELLEPINVTQMFTVGLEYDVVFQLLDKNGDVVEDDEPSVTVKLVDEDNDEDDPIQTWSSDDADISQSGDEWELDDMRCWFDGQIIISGENASDGITHKGNLTVDVGHATISYTPSGATAGIETEDLVVSVKGIDANGDPLPDGTDLYFWCEDSEDIDVGGSAGNTDAVDFKDADTSIELDENGEGEFELDEVGDNKTSINATFVDYDPANGNRTMGKFSINFPMFTVTPTTIYLGQSNIVTIVAKDHNGDYIEGINLTLLGNTITQPDPAMTNAEGKVSFSVTPESSGIANVTIAREVKYIDGILNWTNAVVTDTYVTIESMGTFTISVSKSPIFQGETLTVTINDGNTPVASADVSFGEETEKTGTDGTVTFIVPDPGVESAIYTIKASKVGYYDKERSITVLKKYKISIVLPSKAETEKKFTVTIIARGQKLAGATVTFEGKTVTSDGDGKASFTAPNKKGTYTMTAEYENYETASVTVTIAKASPGFELLALIVAIGVAFLLIKRRRRQ